MGTKRSLLDLKYKCLPQQELYSIFQIVQSCYSGVMIRTSGHSVASVGSRLMKDGNFTERSYGVYCLSDQLLCMTFRNSRAALPSATTNPYESQLRTDLKDLVILDIG